MYMINSPVWSDNCVYVKTTRVGQIVGIKYRDRYGNQIYPNTIRLTSDVVSKFEKRKFKWGLAWKIPLGEFE